MPDLETLRRGGYKGAGLTKLKLTCSLESFPLEILDLGNTLEQLDLSGTGLTSLPPNFGASLPKLKVAFFSSCGFTAFPRALASCPQLEMVAFRGNGMTSIPEAALPPRLRWLILTDNKLGALPRSIGNCERLEKCMLAGNMLTSLPEEMKSCKKLGLLRLSSNKLDSLPDWIFEMPELAFLSFAGNPCSMPGTPVGTHTDEEPNGSVESNGTAQPSLPGVPWSNIEVHHTLGEGASGVISKGLWKIDEHTGEEVAIKLFKGSLTSDGAPEDEMAACIAAGQHENIIDILGRVHEHPDEDGGTFKGGLVMQLIPSHYQTLGLPPSLTTCTRDNYPADATLSAENALSILGGIAAAAAHLHSMGIAHGDLYAHNILTSADGHALLGDFGAATVHGQKISPLLEKLEVLAFAHLLEEIIDLLPTTVGKQHLLVVRLQELHRKCSLPCVSKRPTFDEVVAKLKQISDGQGLTKLPV